MKSKKAGSGSLFAGLYYIPARIALSNVFFSVGDGTQEQGSRFPVVVVCFCFCRFPIALILCRSFTLLSTLSLILHSVFFCFVFFSRCLPPLLASHLTLRACPSRWPSSDKQMQVERDRTQTQICITSHTPA